MPVLCLACIEKETEEYETYSTRHSVAAVIFSFTPQEERMHEHSFYNTETSLQTQPWDLPALPARRLLCAQSLLVKVAHSS